MVIAVYLNHSVLMLLTQCTLSESLSIVSVVIVITIIYCYCRHSRTFEIQTGSIYFNGLQCLMFFPSVYSGGFPGSQPVSMDVQNIKLLHEKPYRVSWKADGVR